jgi:hypothetical protein
MFRALLAHPQEALNERHLVYCVRVMSVGCTRSQWNSSVPTRPADSQLKLTTGINCCMYTLLPPDGVQLANPKHVEV